MYTITQHSEVTCGDTSAYAEASYLRPTSLRYYTPEVHPPTLLETSSKTPFVEACDTTLRRLHPHAGLRPHIENPNRLHPTTTCEANGLDNMCGGDDTRTTAPHWDPAVQAPFSANSSGRYMPGST
eukprot:9487962-Pyramimonas_sp.AAC.1